MAYEFESREQAWETLAQCLDDQVNLPKARWADDLQERTEAAQQYLADNPPPAAGQPVQITLSPESMRQIRAEVAPLKEIAERGTRAIDLVTEMADAQELWMALFTEGAGLINEKGDPVEFSESERAWMRDVLGRVMVFSGREDRLPAVARPDDYEPPVAPPAPTEPARPVEQVVITPEDAVVTVREEPKPAIPSQNRRARNPAWAALEAEQGRPPETPGVEVFDEAEPHDCRAELDVDDICMKCGRHVPTGPGVRQHA